MAFRYFEDFVPGETVALGSRAVGEAEIIAFAQSYDPQWFHTDPVRAQESAFGGLVASGWHISAVFMRIFVDGMLRESSALASPGVDELRWKKPLRPGDVLSATATVAEVMPSHTKPDRGLVKHDCTVTNQRGETVMTLRTLALFARRPAR